ncbi:MAG: hypothetical protein HY646_13000, partial [Acidobacteria bacterium]|nr:hypothetical protein [Acidobacteriota bacterium]
MSSADGVAHFFGRLGYNTNARTPQSPANFEITADSTLKAIKRIELLADHDGLFQVYLFELSSVTIALTRLLTRVFRNRTGNYLLVLTSDYERLDFVLAERSLPVNDKASAFTQKQVGIRPRVLTVHRLKPERMHLRVMRRLTWTESDPFFQYDKLLAAYAVADWTEDSFNNRALFSDHYLIERLPEFPEWADDPKPSYRKLIEIYKGAASLYSGKGYSVIRSGLIEPVLRALNFHSQSQDRSIGGHVVSSFRLSAAPDGGLLALCLAYPWASSLDGKYDRRDKDTPDHNPGAAVVSLLENSECAWAIVTNGKIWRLYSRDTHSRATNYYEIDLEELLAQTGPAADPSGSFRYFWIPFRRSSFEPVEQMREGRTVRLCLLDRLLLESEDYAKSLGERLKERVFEDVFPHLALGFIQYIEERDGLHANLSQESLDSVYEGTLSILYRLLFLLYAEARALLPVKEVRGYFAASLTKLRHELHEAGGKIEDEAASKLKHQYRNDQYGLYERLTKLFGTIDAGDVALNVPVYNGGLFLTRPVKGDTGSESRIAAFLLDHRIPDRFLARALHLLMHDVDDKRHDLVFVDYKSLGVRHLGSIYEGLLEFR